MNEKKNERFLKMNATSTEREMDDTPLDLSRCSSVETIQMHSPQMEPLRSPLWRSPNSSPSTPYPNNNNWHESPTSPDHPSYPSYNVSYILAASRVLPISRDAGTQQALTVQYPQDDARSTRPFKAYIAHRGGDLHMASISCLNPESAQRFECYRATVLERIRASNGGQSTISNPNMRRTSTRADSSTCANVSNSNRNVIVKDEEYLKRRKKNNEAAKNSRDRRRMKEDEIVIRVRFLEQENMRLNLALAASQNKNVSLAEQLHRACNTLEKLGQLDCSGL
ncbi:Protein giant [Pseudolycoriella hygida]|uniref:Protein giant n=1 Tax=Pseudolycoriella hygida TaxID=35572 RepID=A0A9Q0MQY5_9DIPT|nr:Protein giant [Pseudolycoriella hygida]